MRSERTKLLPGHINEMLYTRDYCYISVEIASVYVLEIRWIELSKRDNDPAPFVHSLN